MKQTPSAIIVLASAILATGASVSFATGYNNFGSFLAMLAAFAGVVGGAFLIRACIHDHELAIDVSGRLDFLEELVYLEKLSLEHRKRRSEVARDATSERTSSSATRSYDYNTEPEYKYERRRKEYA